MPDQPDPKPRTIDERLDDLLREFRSMAAMRNDNQHPGADHELLDRISTVQRYNQEQLAGINHALLRLIRTAKPPGWPIES
jgi:hypothetical protein